jgi:hypothetical protein
LLIVQYGCPIIFMTLNPADNHSPLALLYAGERIELREFDPDHYPYQDRVRNMVSNPLAVVEYFHNTIQTIIEGPLKGGLFGDLLHHFGTIEYQGRGTPPYPSRCDSLQTSLSDMVDLDPRHHHPCRNQGKGEGGSSISVSSHVLHVVYCPRDYASRHKG